ncbi:MAG: aspartate/glutamate racemase family protein [Pseudomonadota bacterium]
MGGLSACERFEGQRHFIGTITPSGNTVVERITLGVLRELPTASAHFSRTPVFGTTDPSPDTYAAEPFLAAARLLAHAAPQVLVWNGSKGAGIGFAHDRVLANAIHAETGIVTTTSILGLSALFAAQGIRRLGVVTPYSAAGQKKMLDCLVSEGFECVGSANAGLSDNLSYASVSGQQIAEMSREVAKSRPDAIVCLCTNFPAAIMAAPLEAELRLPVYDSTALGVWHALRLAGCDTSPAAPLWGSLFRQAA